MRPLETLHNNLCFKNLNNFLTRMINDRSTSHDSILLSNNMFSISSFDEDMAAVASKLENELITKPKTENEF